MSMNIQGSGGAGGAAGAAGGPSSSAASMFQNALNGQAAGGANGAPNEDMKKLLDLLFQAMDVNKDGIISQDELQQFMQNGGSGSSGGCGSGGSCGGGAAKPPAAGKQDANGSMAELFSKLDVNGNGSISKAEFMSSGAQMVAQPTSAKG